MRIGNECIKVEVTALPSLPRERKRELYLELRKAGFKAQRFPYSEQGRAKAEARRDELKARARDCGFDIDELYFYCDVSLTASF